MDPRVEQYVRMGYELSYGDPSVTAGIPLDEPWMSYYRQGMAAGRSARAEADSKWQGPAIGEIIPGSETWDAYQESVNALLEPLFHKHEPHIETEPTEVVIP